MNLIQMQTDYEATHHCVCTPPIPRRWKSGERGRLYRQWSVGIHYSDLGLTIDDMRYIIQYMRRVAPFRPKA